MKGYLTVFLSLSLSILAGFILLFTKSAIVNAQKVRFECIADTAMNAVLSEYHIELFERYGLIYVDASYLQKEPTISNVEDRLRYYLQKNFSFLALDTGNRESKPWGALSLKNAEINTFEVAVAGKGASMRHQAILYAEDVGLSEEIFQTVHHQRAQILDEQNPMSDWEGVMGQLSGMELPIIIDEFGLPKEVPLSNPADWVYALAGSDVIYLAEVNTKEISSVSVQQNQYYSHRNTSSASGRSREYAENDALFMAYLFEKMGCYSKPKPETVLACQIEYIAEGEASDWNNLRAVIERLFNWRFADNVSLAFADSGLRAEAENLADQIEAVQLKEEFKEPVVESILFASAFLESISDIRNLVENRRVPISKNEHSMSVMHVENGDIYCTSMQEGLTYEQYLACILSLLPKDEVNFRTMDLMEMDIRRLSGNDFFAMDWCIESYEANITATGSYGGNYNLRRSYGFY